MFTNQVLLDNDKEKLSVVAKALNAKVDFVVVGVGMQLEKEYKQNLVTIIDEVDCAIIDHDLKLFAFDDNIKQIDHHWTYCNGNTSVECARSPST